MDWDHRLVVCSNGLGEVLVIVINIRPADGVGNCFTILCDRCYVCIIIIIIFHNILDQVLVVMLCLATID